MNGYQGIRHYSTRSILYRAANASEGGLGLGGGEKNYASKQQCYGRIEFRHAIPPASRSGLATAFCGIYRGARKEAVKISMKVINRMDKCFGWAFDLKCRLLACRGSKR